MKYTILVFIACLLAHASFGQNKEIDSLWRAIQQHPQQDTTRVNLLISLSDYSTVLPTEELEKVATEMLNLSRKNHYAPGEGIALLRLCTVKGRKGDNTQAALLMQQADSIAKATNDPGLTVRIMLRKAFLKLRDSENQQALALYEQAEERAVKEGDMKLAAISQTQIGLTYRYISNYPKTIEYLLKAVRSAEGSNCSTCLYTGWEMLGSTYTLLGDQEKALFYYQKALAGLKQLDSKYQLASVNISMGEQYRLMGKYQEAIRHYNSVFSLTEDLTGVVLAESGLADVYTRLDSLPLASKLANSSLHKVKQLGDKNLEASIDAILARIHLKKGQVDSALYYGRQGLDTAQKIGSIEYMRDNAEALANAFAYKNDFANAYRYHQLFINYRDSMLNSEISKKTAVLQYNYDLEKKESQILALNQQQKVQRTYLFGTLIVLLLILVTTGVLFRNNRLKQRANQLLQKQKLELQDQRDQTNKVLTELQRTQAQLIQKEKMASLGELTAGIAHEIQNPLNFVNNFSAVNKELMIELKQEAKIGNIEEVLSLAGTIEANEQKIEQHGKRADGIVKGMLQHARPSSGTKEPTDINQLAEEYLGLSFHGMRARDKEFTAAIETHFDRSIGKITVVPQDLGRVLLNLYNNAFYAVQQKKQLLNGTYEPVVEVSTKREGDQIIITIRDNGTGMSQNVADKIFQPFFTTKPTGEGTGLGLSLSYDIVTKGHGGELKVHSREGEGAEFIIQLPVA